MVIKVSKWVVMKTLEFWKFSSKDINKNNRLILRILTYCIENSNSQSEEEKEDVRGSSFERTKVHTFVGAITPVFHPKLHFCECDSFINVTRIDILIGVGTESWASSIAGI